MKNVHVIQTWIIFLDPNIDEQAKAFTSTHSHEGDYFIHVRSDVALHKRHQHSQLLEQKLKGRRGEQAGATEDVGVPGLPMSMRTHEDNYRIGLHTTPSAENKSQRTRLKTLGGDSGGG